jgi:hypothetical protein
VPAALIRETPFQKTLANTFSCEGGSAKLVENPTDALGVVAAEFPPDVKPILTPRRIATKNYRRPFQECDKEHRAELEHFLGPNKLYSSTASKGQWTKSKGVEYGC